MIRGRARGAPRDGGAVLVLAAVMIVVIFVVAAVVIDLSLVRQNRQSDKSATDMAVGAGVRALDEAGSAPRPWKGICAARAWLVANHSELAAMTETWTDGSGSTVHGSDPCAATGSLPFTQPCIPGAPASWGRLVGLADGGRLRVTIRSGYLLPDAAFPEDTVAGYGGDTGSSFWGGCDHIAVILEEGEGAIFGRVAGASGYESVTRSVARITLGTTGDVTAALLLLERTDCQVLRIGGVSGATVRVEGSGPDPGVVHADSLGNGANCNAADPQNGNIFQVDSNPPSPRIVAGRATTPVGSEAPGQLSTAALSASPGAVPAVAASPTPDEVCAQVAVTDCTATTPVTGTGPVGRDQVGRGRIDARYRLPVVALRNEAAIRFAWSASDAAAAGWTVVGCAGPFTAARLFVDCAAFNGSGVTFGPTVDEIVFTGTVSVAGNNSTLTFHSPAKVFVAGSAVGSAVSLLGSDNRILLNQGSATDGSATGTPDGFVCDDQHASTPDDRARLVVGRGPIVAEGGSGKVLRMCSTTVFMMDSTGPAVCPVPLVDGVAPYDNTCRGWLRVAGNNALDWSAPNVNTVTAPTPAELAAFEDLAFWTETEGAAGVSSIEGNGGVRLFGIFFTPNAKPFRVGGNGAYRIEDAQFITRRLEVAGNALLRMRPLPQNSIQIPVLGGFSLVR